MIFRATFVLLALALTASGAEPGAFAGVWKLNLQKSAMKDGQPLALNKSHVISITSQGPLLQWAEQRISRDGEFFANFAKLDDSAADSKLIGFRNGTLTEDGQCRIAISANRLEYKFKGSHGPGKEFNGTRTFLLSPGGQTMLAEVEANRYGQLLAWTEFWERF